MSTCPSGHLLHTPVKSELALATENEIGDRQKNTFASDQLMGSSECRVSRAFSPTARSQCERVTLAYRSTPSGLYEGKC